MSGGNQIFSDDDGRERGHRGVDIVVVVFRRRRRRCRMWNGIGTEVLNVLDDDGVVHGDIDDERRPIVVKRETAYYLSRRVGTEPTPDRLAFRLTHLRDLVDAERRRGEGKGGRHID